MSSQRIASTVIQEWNAVRPPDVQCFANHMPFLNCISIAEHAAVRSKAKAFRQPNLWATDAASPYRSSGVDVAQITKPISRGSTFPVRKASDAAEVSSCRRLSWPTRTCRSEIPVRVWIQSSVVSTIYSRSLFVRIVLGVADPTCVYYRKYIRVDPDAILPPKPVLGFKTMSPENTSRSGLELNLH